MSLLACNRLVFPPSPFSKEQRNRDRAKMSLLSCNNRSVFPPPPFTPSASFLKSKRDRTLSPVKAKFFVFSTASPSLEPERITIESDLKEMLNLRLKTIVVTKETWDDGKPLRPVGRLLSNYWMAVFPALFIILTNRPAFLRFLTANVSGITVLIVMAVILYEAIFSGPQVRNIEKRNYVVIEEASIKETKD